MQLGSPEPLPLTPGLWVADASRSARLSAGTERGLEPPVQLAPRISVLRAYSKGEGGGEDRVA